MGVVLCRVGGALPRGLPRLAAWVARCRVGGGALQGRWFCFAAQVQLCRVSDRILTCLGPMGAPQEAKLHPRGKPRPPNLQSTTTHAAKRDLRGKGPEDTSPQ